MSKMGRVIAAGRGLMDHAKKLIRLGDGPTIYKVASDGSLRRTDFGKRPTKAQVKKNRKERGRARGKN